MTYEEETKLAKSWWKDLPIAERRFWLEAAEAVACEPVTFREAYRLCLWMTGKGQLLEDQKCTH